MSDPLVNVSRETMARLARFRDLLVAENARQNLVSRATGDSLWDRHILDSAQLVSLGEPAGSWVDIGSGGGLPGMVIACMVQGPVTLIEPRRLRAEFLERASRELGLANVTVQCAKAERVAGRVDTITARAVASLDRLLRMAIHLAHPASVWILPKGKSATSELAQARHSWQCDALTVPSLTDPEADILVLRNVEARAK